MSSGKERGGRRGRRWLALVLVLVLVAGGVAAWQYGLLDDVLHDQQSADPLDPVNVPPPAGVKAPAIKAPSPVAAQVALTPVQPLDEQAVRAAVDRLLHKKGLGKHVRALIAPLGGGQPTYSLGRGDAIPASTTKLVTTTSALLALGPDATFTTKVVGRGHSIVLVGGGDPYLERKPNDPALDGVPVGADVTTLATKTAKALKHRHVTRVSLGYDDSLFSGPAVNPEWEKDYIPDAVVAPIGALWVDEGRPASRYGRVADPALDAAQAFAAALERAGITVTGAPSAEKGRGATLASMSSAPLSQIVEHILLVSDNEGAEVLLRQVGLARGGEGSFTAGRRAVIALMRENGIDLSGSVLYDGSGLSRHDRLDPAVLMAVLRLDSSPQHPELRSVVSGLPVAGFSGSLASRMDQGPRSGLGRVRAKTGTLTGVSSLAGIALDLDGDPIVFVLMADELGPYQELSGRVAEDTAAAALGACHCGA